jgi:hypothetical protein
MQLGQALDKMTTQVIWFQVEIPNKYNHIRAPACVPDELRHFEAL